MEDNFEYDMENFYKVYESARLFAEERINESSLEVRDIAVEACDMLAALEEFYHAERSYWESLIEEGK